ncbi:MAG TPA: aspartate-semialdehyde dehydrogenase, partial [Steroidobacteraceae bacterium]|nr:aspartate-semialdehyde dehydrogenase [Steroidobacteraceae bacterium]
MSGSLARVAIVGATGAVGTELIACLQQRQFPLSDLRLFASQRSSGRRMAFCNELLPVEPLEEGSLSSTHIALFSAGAARSRQFAPYAVRAGAIVIDNSSAFRMDA